MPEKDIQKIGVLLSFQKSDTFLITSALTLCSKFGKDLIIIGIDKGDGISDESYHIIQRELAVVKDNFPDCHPTFQILKKPGNQLPRILADDLEVILLVAGRSRFRDLDRPLRSSPIPFLFLDDHSDRLSSFKRVLVPVDMRKQNKGSLLWSAYFGRHLQSEVIAIGANDKSKDARKSVTAHLLSFKNHLTKTGVVHKIYKGSKSSLAVQQEAFETAQELGADLLILLGSSYVTWLDLMIGLPEEKILNKAKDLPVLIVNPKRDIYLLCE